MTAMTRYCFTAAALGVGWFVVLLVPRITREWLVADTTRNILCLVAASVIVSVVCRRFIARAETPGAHLTRAIVIPYLGCLVYLTLVSLTMWVRSLWVGGLANLHDTASLYVMGLTATTLSLLVVIPYGWLCQSVMAAVAPDQP